MTNYPIIFNCWKHHAGFIAEQIKSASSGNRSLPENIPAMLIKIGDSLFDLYTGSLTPREINEHIIFKLKKDNHYEKTGYSGWINDAKKQYRIIELPDNSLWTLRMGKLKNKYIHIHPAKYSIHTIRVRSLTLKTTIAVLIWTNIYGGTPFELEVINNIRQKILSASRIKSVTPDQGIGKLVLFFSHIIK